MYLQNVDTLEIAYDILNYDCLSGLFETLEELKQESKEGFAPAVANFSPYAFQVMGAGTKNHAYILKSDIFDLYISKVRSKNNNVYPVKAYFHSSFLWSYGLKGAINLVNNFIDLNFGEIINTKVSRVDLCCHTDNFHFSLDDAALFCRRSKNSAFFHDAVPVLDLDNVRSYGFGHRFTGFMFGSQNLLCRIYDKSFEIKHSHKEWFKSIWENAGMDIDNVWNIEFQLRRDFLREVNISTVDDLLNNISILWNYLVEKWLILKVQDNTRLERCSVASAWHGLFGLFGSLKGALIRRQKQLDIFANNLIPAITGYISSFASCLGFNPCSGNIFNYSIDGLYKLLARLSADYLEDKNKKFSDIVNFKRSLRVGGLAC